MGILAGPYVGAAVLLALAGGFKLARPGPAAGALRAPPAVARLLGAVELVIGLGALVVGTSALAWAVAACYLGFAGFVVLSMARRSTDAGCGCFGESEAPAGLLHLGLDIAAAGVAIAVAIGPGANLAEILSDQPLAGIPFVVLAGACTGLAYAVISVLPRTLEEVRV